MSLIWECKWNDFGLKLCSAGYFVLCNIQRQKEEILQLYKNYQ